MKIVLFTQEDPFYVKVFFDEFLKRYKPIEDIQAMVISKAMGDKTVTKLARRMIDFYGPLDFFRIGCRFVYYKIMGKISGLVTKASRRRRTYSVKQTATMYGIRVIERNDLNSSEFIEMTKALCADLFISIASPIIFREELLAVPRIDAINIHSAPLPKYRGMLPSFWQLLNGESNAGITIHRMARGIDTGEIIKQGNVPIEEGESLHQLIERSKRIGAEMMVEVLDEFKSGNVQYSIMEREGSYYSFPRRSDVAEFRRRGRRLL